MRHLLLAVAGLATLAAACGAGGPTGLPPSEGVTRGSPGPADLASIDPELGPIVDPVVADAAARRSVPPAEVAVTAVEATTWSDGALGCPRPGELYTQALVDGHRILVDAGGVTLDYRVTGPGAFRLCEGAPAATP